MPWRSVNNTSPYAYSSPHPTTHHPPSPEIFELLSSSIDAPQTGYHVTCRNTEAKQDRVECGPHDARAEILRRRTCPSPRQGQIAAPPPSARRGLPHREFTVASFMRKLRLVGRFTGIVRLRTSLRLVNAAAASHKGSSMYRVLASAALAAALVQPVPSPSPAVPRRQEYVRPSTRPPSTSPRRRPRTRRKKA